jgi:hypothetical protein
VHRAFAGGRNGRSTQSTQLTALLHRSNRQEGPERANLRNFGSSRPIAPFRADVQPV